MRVAMAALAVGLSRAAFEYARDYAKDRVSNYITWLKLQTKDKISVHFMPPVFIVGSKLQICCPNRTVSLYPISFLRGTTWTCSQAEARIVGWASVQATPTR